MHQSPMSLKQQMQLSSRLLSFGKQVKNKINDKRNERIQQTLTECKFKPNINKRSPFKSRNSLNQYSKTSRTFGEFYEDQIKFQKNKMLKVELSIDKKQQKEENIRKLSNMRHSSAKRELKKVKSKYNDYSIYSPKNPNLSSIQPLLRDSSNRRKQFKKEDALTFIPTINPKSKNLKN